MLLFKTRSFGAKRGDIGMVEEQRLSEDWIKEYEKNIITRKIHQVSENLGVARYVFSTSGNWKLRKDALARLIGSIDALVSALPLLKGEEKQIMEWQEKVNEFNYILMGDMETIKRKGIKVIKVRDGLNVYTFPSTSGALKILKEVENLLREINLWTTKKGLRITLPFSRKVGKESVLEAEGIDKLVDLE